MHRIIDTVSTREAEPTKGSRHIADASPCQTESEALAFVDSIRAREPKANHHCWAFVLADDSHRSSDDGEPGGTAGRPILAQIRGHDLRDIVVVVTRYFGGTKLGTGGLIRAYGGAARELLATLDSQEVVETVALAFELDYPYADQIAALAQSFGTVEQTYGAAVSFVVHVPQGQTNSFRAQVTEATQGKVRWASQSEPD